MHLGKLGLVVALVALPCRADDAVVSPVRTQLMGADPVYMRSGLLAPPKGDVTLGLDGEGKIACDYFSARPDRRGIQIVADDLSGIYPACYRLGTVSLSGEVGISKHLGAFFSFTPLGISTQSGGPVSRTATGLSDFTGGLRLQVFDDDLQGAMVVAVGVPIGRSSTRPPLGPGDFRADFMAYVSKLFERLPFLISVGMGMRLRGWAEVNETSAMTTVIRYSDELRFEMRFGYAFMLDKPWLTAILVSLAPEGRWSLAPGVEDGIGVLDSPTGTELNLGLEVVALLPWGLRFSVNGGQLVAGHSVPIFTFFGAGIGVVH